MSTPFLKATNSPKTPASQASRASGRPPRRSGGARRGGSNGVGVGGQVWNLSVFAIEPLQLKEISWTFGICSLPPLFFFGS